MRLAEHRSEPLENNLEMLVVGIIINESKTLVRYSIGLGMVLT